MYRTLNFVLQSFEKKKVVAEIIMFKNLSQVLGT